MLLSSSVLQSGCMAVVVVVVAGLGDADAGVGEHVRAVCLSLPLPLPSLTVELLSAGEGLLSADECGCGEDADGSGIDDAEDFRRGNARRDSCRSVGAGLAGKEDSKATG